MRFEKPVYVTRPDLPPLEEFIPSLETIWKNKWLTNQGPFHQELEHELARFLGVNHLSLFCNGTLALVAALQTMRIRGEVITTPFSFAATAHSLLWNGLEPIFADIDPVTMNLDPNRVEEAITPRTTALLPVHCYGTPCDTEALQKIADMYGLRVIYDAAHAFGVERHDQCILNEGDLSILSFHATKVFNTFEGGAVISPDESVKKRVDFLKNFGFANETTVVAPGINGKMNELQAAFGLLQLNHVEAAIASRGRIDAAYRSVLGEYPGIRMLETSPLVKRNYSYFPILVSDDHPESRDELYERLKAENVFCRRYFYPLLSSMPMYRGLKSASPANLNVAEDVASRVICLPIHTEMDEDDARWIGELIRSGRGTA